MTRIQTVLFAALAAMAIGLYAKSFHYDFVYDDHWRVEQNSAISTLKNLPRFFYDRTTSSSLTQLHRDSYRPIVTTSYALDFALFGTNPAGYRMHNVALHILIGFLVFLSALRYFRFSTGASLLSVVIFLFHPLQVGVVVWIAERTNLLGVFYGFLAMILWHQFHTQNKIIYLIGCLFSFSVALLSREIAVSIPALILIYEVLNRRWKSPLRHLISSKSLWVLITLTLSYLVARSAILDQTAISPYWGGTLLSNLANVAAVVPLYAQKIVWPYPLQLTYGGLAIVESWADRRAISGAAFGLFFIFGIINLWKRESQLTLCLMSMVLLWFPGSNIIPLTTLFAERLLYPFVLLTGFIVAFIFDQWRHHVSGTFQKILIGGVTVVLMLSTVQAIPEWHNDRSLWKQQTLSSPNSWFSWACYAQIEFQALQKEKDLKGVELTARLDSIEKSFIQALKLRPPVGSASTLFFNLVEVNIKQNKLELAREHLRRAQALQKQVTSMSSVAP